MLRHLFYLLLLSCLSACASLEPAEEPQQVVVPVYFVTDRNIVNTADSPMLFGIDRGELSQGVSRVALSTRRRDASLAEPLRWQTYPDALGRDELVSTELLADNEFLPAISAGADTPADKLDLVLYIHGYNRDYESAVLDAADLIYEINLQYPLILYSWPSAGSVLGYASDQVNMDWSTFHLNQFLLSLLNNDAVGKIHILAHSMGNSGLLNSLKYLTDSGKLDNTGKIGQVVMLAPDVDTAIFARDFLPVLTRLAEGITLYANAKDFPLQTSNRVNHYSRLGNARDGIFTADDMDTIDISGAVSIFNSHDAHLEIPAVQEDLSLLLNLQRPASARTTLHEAGNGQSGHYWEIYKQ